MFPERTSPIGAPRTIVIGDVHGCLDELQDLLRACAIDWSADRVVLVGDLVAKGPDSRGVLQLARERKIEAVLGNHDAKVLTFAPDTSATDESHKSSKQHARVARTLHAADWAYLGGLPLYRDLLEVNVVVVHAGLIAGIPLAHQPRDLIINMRSITPEGEPSKRVEAGVPWGSRWPGPRHVVFGHDAVRGLQQHPFATGIDTGCVYGRALTALILPDHRLVSVPARRTYVAI